MKNRIGIIGGGSWGTAIAILLGKKGYEVDMWLRNESQCQEVNKSRENLKYLPGVIIPSNVNITTDIEKSSSNKDIIVLAVPTHGVRGTLKSIKEFINGDEIIVNLAKGIENGTLNRVSQIVEEEIPDIRYTVLSGPSHAEEVAKDIPTAIVAASKCKETAERVQDVFMSPKFRVYTSPDVVGVELGGSLKNVIALGAGISDGLGYGDNTKAALINRGIFEIARLGEKMGADQMSFAGLSGIGDLIVTCTSMHSRNRRAGIKIGEGMSMEEAVEAVGMVVEGIKTTKSAYELAQKMGVKMPITEEIYGVLYNGKEVKNSVINLMLRDKTHEIQDIVHKEDNDW
ncbi:NAD(P)H-dependent glycerol-3-phosphate dehydrogenase [Sporosalibacterium faouarense]|uniref:NAD(P)H-dependent glycerol-3-phosphate dehydrogenase n=1 Tax=Sporosalibacterium faouarense TaxID=516123 RepID=UPI00141CAAE8|nr:NAD(P)H-dependent glycerol-3-phosphate dehydrogenase [Sporosalibacterium faouarense]MTI47762.1 NAD(P)H-dependent glycerol-3-phosphate dehydrogenase [Bacillota bacterium]